MEFHISRSARDKYHFDENLFSFSGNVIFANFQAARQFVYQMNLDPDREAKSAHALQAGELNAMGMIDEILHLVVGLYRQEIDPTVMQKAVLFIKKEVGATTLNTTLLRFTELFPPMAVYRGQITPKKYLAGRQGDRLNREILLEELLMLWLANVNPAFSPFDELFSDATLRTETAYLHVIDSLSVFFEKQAFFGPDQQNLVSMLRSPAIAEPHSLQGQLEYIRAHWARLLGSILQRILGSLDLLSEEEKAFIPGGPGPSRVLQFNTLDSEIEKFSQDSDWMPNCILVAKNTMVWLDQLSRKYSREIKHLDQIPEEELANLARLGITGLWLIGIWERSQASQRIKQLCGNQDAVASAYSLASYIISGELGGDAAFVELRDRAMRYGIRLASDMVPNHMGLDSDWVLDHPEWFLSLDESPFPSYRFSGPDLSSGGRIGLFIEDHYYTRNDAAVVFKRVDRSNGREKFIYHGNDGTNMPWNDTAQLNYLNPEVREAIIQTILDVARRFPIIRFDAAMTLAKKHYQRLWFPEPGNGGAIPSRADHPLSREEFDRQMPQEFWREVVDRVTRDVPGTLLLAEAFWMMEGYFVRSLGMHRVYNSAFMNMLRDEQNAEYRQVIKNTLEFDPQILKRYVNFMNNPDEKTAVEQFGKGDKYFGICTLMATLPGLPMFGHGQFEGFSEKYGMEYRRAIQDETVDEGLLERHQREISPLLHRRGLFSEVDHFLLFDFYSNDGTVNENVFAYSNRTGTARGLVLYNNRFSEAHGWIKQSAAFARKHGNGRRLVRKTLSEALSLHPAANRYLIYRDHLEGLEYLLSCQQIHDEGLQVHLNAYQTKVLVDFREVISTTDHDYAQLAKSLNRRGVPSIDAALAEYKLAPILTPFRALTSPQNLAFLRPSVTGQQHKSGPSSYPVELEQYLGTFINATCRYLDVSIKIAPLVARALKQIAFLADMPQLPGKHDYPSASQIKPAVKYFSSAPFTPDQEHLGLFLWVILTPLIHIVNASSRRLNIQSLLDMLHLNDAMQQSLNQNGLDADDSRRTIDLVQGVLALPMWTHEQVSVFQIFEMAFINPSLAQFLKVNIYQDIQWFDRESFEQFTWFLGMVEILEGIDPDSTENELIERLLKVFKVIRDIRKAERDSSYQTKAFLAGITKSKLTFF